MFRRKISQQSLSKLNKKHFLQHSAKLNTNNFSTHKFRWTFLVIFLLAILSISMLLLFGEGNHLRILFEYSIMGFFTFFMGYFGWEIAQKVINSLGAKEDETPQGVCYYFRKNRKY